MGTPLPNAADVLFLLLGAIMILAIAFLMINLIVDVLYVYLDPRVQKS